MVCAACERAAKRDPFRARAKHLVEKDGRDAGVRQLRRSARAGDVKLIFDSRRKRLAAMASAFEKRRIGPDRPEWAAA
jgi:hypothetical protein